MQKMPARLLGDKAVPQITLRLLFPNGARLKHYRLIKWGGRT
jgi:hypothetical protein